MNITFVSHASFIIESGNTRIISDPWLRSKAFNNGWALLSKPADVDFSTIDYIYLSHEHPDHFNLPSLKAIDPEHRKKIKILYQKHASSRIKDACVAMGFGEFIELPLYTWMPLVGSIKLYCGSVGSIDSFLVVKDSEHTVLNLNDCVLNHKHYHYISNKIGKVDILFTQFSFANWVGNDHDQMHGAETKIKNIREQIDIIKPRITVPFASFVYFCSKENSRMNPWANTPEMLMKAIPEVSFMYPGDLVDLKAPIFDSPKAVEKFMQDYQNVVIDETPEAKSVEDISKAIEVTFTEFRKKVFAPFRSFITPVTFFIHDLGLYLKVDVKNEKYEFSEKPMDYRYEVCSQVCWYVFNFTWGGYTMIISGMYLDREFPKKQPLFFRIQNLISTEYFSIKTYKKFKNSVAFLWSKRFEMFYSNTA